MQSLCRVNVYFFFAHIPGLCEVHFFLSHVYFFMRRGKDALLWQLGGGGGGDLLVCILRKDFETVQCLGQPGLLFFISPRSYGNYA